MKKITNESNLQVTFSKRRSGLFKKASELCILCDVEIALVVFSPGEKVFSFGHPSVEAVIKRYFSQAPPQTSDTMQYIEAQRNSKVHELNVELSQINNLLDTVRNHGEELNRLHKAAQAQFWWACQIEEMDRPKLEQFRMALNELKKQISRYCDRTRIHGAPAASTATTNPPTHMFFASGSSNVMIPPHHPQSPPPQVFAPQFFEGSMKQGHHLFGGIFNNMGAYDGPPPGFY